MAHFIREEVLKQIVWGRIFDMTALFYDNIIAFKEMMYQQRSAETEKEMKRRKRIQKMDIEKLRRYDYGLAKLLFFSYAKRASNNI